MNRVVIGKGIRKGVVALDDIKNGGYNIAVDQMKSNEEVYSIETVLHFNDRDSLIRTVNVMRTILKKR